ncbi:uncharacterized protein BT62DRAFT_627762 [Guyanagaster necrorhizus]|uniref:Uncharacterized protein n=1 Tax=Guyanagaster necrorhizus TaxID=856835 RepID=A0A9P7VE14_9AGAR|nr:uncharacterized protein BT62DRAFT_773673 [Guyanagaster necrorhizus MCA 3950]XP_043033793.1 uncharacterized protein BT62DRAFT_627762 [Guyanagaster necrorhizus MCA 3950]KAG7439186.1 hypothetical protein BT62DRAFT_773673 [Guyanagaster necrorhizus MCA 3950]KAG7440293.1 hypothetical protein BT62DRAFT_627762 [Guyanagaster necrorhizus MCA 3950]
MERANDAGPNGDDVARGFVQVCCVALFTGTMIRRWAELPFTPSICILSIFLLYTSRHISHQDVIQFLLDI